MDLESERRCGKVHHVDLELPPYAADGIRTPLCPACPQVGINVEEEALLQVDASKP
jgi:hypothetical protein